MLGSQLSQLNSRSARAAHDDAQWHPTVLRRRLALLGSLDLDTAAKRLTTELETFNQLEPKPSQLGAIELMRASLEAILPRLQTRLDGATPPITHAMRTQAQKIDVLLAALADAYLRLIQSADHTWGLFRYCGLRQQLHAPLVRAIELFARRLLLAHRLYTRAPRGAWTSLHTLYLIAARWNIAHRDINGRGASPVAVYCKALLLAFAEPSRLPPGDLQRARDYIARFANIAEIVRADRPDSRDNAFVIEPLQDRPGIARGRFPASKDDARHWLLLTAPLLRRIDQQLDALARGTPPVQLGLPQEPDTQRYRDLLTRLKQSWSSIPRRRTRRVQFRPRAELFISFPGIWTMLGAQPESLSARNEWAIVNESPGGFALRHARGTLPALRIGDLVGIRLFERGDTLVCLVRWIRSEGGEHLELGIQQLAPRFSPATYRRNDSNVAGSMNAVSHVPVLYAPVSPQFNRVPVVVAPARLLAAGTTLTIEHHGVTVELRADRALEITPHATLWQVSAR